MPVTYADSVKQSGEEYERLQQVSEMLRDVLGSSAQLVRATWDRVTDAKGRPLYQLTLEDMNATKRALFERTELVAPTHMRIRLRQLWGDVLQARSDEFIQRVVAGGE